MAELTAPRVVLRSDGTAIAAVGELGGAMLKLPQVPIATDHVLHGGLYARTVLVPAGVTIAGALIKIATLLILQGSALVYAAGGVLTLNGYNVLPASAGRKQAFFARSDVYLTMIFPTSARSVEEAEREFTDEASILMSRRSDPDRVVITGE